MLQSSLFPNTSLFRSCAGGVRVPSIQEQLTAGVSPIDRYPPKAVHIPGPRPVEQLKRGDWEIRCPTCRGDMDPLLILESTVRSEEHTSELQSHSDFVC